MLKARGNGYNLQQWGIFHDKIFCAPYCYRLLGKNFHFQTVDFFPFFIDRLNSRLEFIVVNLDLPLS